MANTRKIHYKNVNDTADTHIGHAGDMFYDPSTPALRVSNGVDAGGVTGVVQVTRVVAVDNGYEYELQPSDHFVIVNPVTHSGVTIFLPQTAVDGKQYIIKRDPTASTWHSIRVQPEGPTTVEGDSSYNREWGNQCWTFTFDAGTSTWWITGFTSQDPN